MNEPNQMLWDITVKQISYESSILFIGPELFRMGDKSVMRYVRDNIWATAQGVMIDYYYPDDGFFLFAKPPHKKLIRYELTDALQKITKDEAFLKQNSEMLRLLAEMPFHLIIVITPDKLVSSALAQYGVEHNTGYLISEDKPIIPVAKPSAKKPLVYNLCGSIDDNESLILDYKDLFSFLKTALDKSKLPVELGEAVRNAQSCLFLGFEMQKWYAQLLLQLVQEASENPDKYSDIYRFQDENFGNFFKKQFNITPLEEEDVFVRQLHESLKKAGKLRAVNNKAASPTMATVRQYVSEYDFTNALNEIEKFAQVHKSDTLNDITILKGDNTYFERESPKIFQSEREVMRLRLSDRILSLAQSIFPS